MTFWKFDTVKKNGLSTPKITISAASQIQTTFWNNHCPVDCRDDRRAAGGAIAALLAAAVPA
jgi:hypothetical protein